jgi:F-type H+-transporting ATPase subunit delta
MIVASRYAKSLIDLAAEKNLLEVVNSDMIQIKSVCQDSREFRVFLKSPIINTDKKVSTIKAVFEGKVNTLTLDFLSSVTKGRREAIIPEIASSYLEQFKKQKNILSAVIVSANGLDADTKQKALDLIKSQFKGEVELVEKTDSSIIGGFILKIGDKQIDRSVARQLTNLKKQLTNKALN